MTEQEIFAYLKGKGFNDYAVAGIMGNLQDESGFHFSCKSNNNIVNIVFDFVGTGLKDIAISYPSQLQII